MSKWTAEWHHFDDIYFCLGEWRLFKDGKKIDCSIPFAYEPAGTFGSYVEVSEDGEHNTVKRSYEDGLREGEWCGKHREWLSSIAEEGEWKDVYAAFAEHDFRKRCCGACH